MVWINLCVWYSSKKKKKKKKKKKSISFSNLFQKVNFIYSHYKWNKTFQKFLNFDD